MDEIVFRTLEGGYPSILARRALRYEAIRRLTPNAFAELYRQSLSGESAFDELVDKIVIKHAKRQDCG